MNIAALIAWIVTAAGGFYLLATWVAKGGHRQQAGASNFPPALIFGHFALAAVGLILWIIYVITKTKGLAWTAFGLLVLIALLGFTMLIRWLPTYRGRTATANLPDAITGSRPAEGHFPVAAVAGHGLLAVTTVVLVLLAAAGVGG
jgi:hypothetical protein